MVEEDIRRGFAPLLAVLSSTDVERIASKNSLSFAELLLPFCTVECEVKDPAGASVSSRLLLDARDIRRDGFLLSLTVLPSVLHESVSSVASTSDATAAFTETLLRWAEPAEHEFLRTYIACLFAVSSQDQDPLGELSKLVQSQHSQQTVLVHACADRILRHRFLLSRGATIVSEYTYSFQHGASSSASLSPAYCVHPKWMLPNTYKYHVLVHDVTTGDETRANEVFASMCSVYGTQNCHMLRLNSGSGTELPDVWLDCLKRRSRGLERGLSRARKNVLSKTTGSLEADDGTSGEVAEASNNGFSQAESCTTSCQHGCTLNSEDRKRIFSLMKEFTCGSLIPFVERQIRTMNEQIAARRGISRSLTTGVRKWFGAATTVQANAGSASVSYSSESSEMQMRRLADLCFVFGLYAYAHQLYQSLKKTFAVDQAWLYHAGSLEMAAITAYLSNPQMSAKQYPQHYMENALNYYTTTCMRPILAMRTVLLSALILNKLNLHAEAASQLLKLTSLDDDLFGGVLLERSSVCFGNAKMPRKMAFHYVLAGHRYFKAGQGALSLECYRQALSEYAHKQWFFAEDHVLYTLARDHGSHDIALGYCLELFRPGSLQHEDQRRQFFARLLELLSRVHGSNGLPLTLPVSVIVARLFYVIYDGQSQQAVPELISERTDEDNGLPTWNSLERTAFHFFFGGSSKFVPVPSVTDACADYSVTRGVPSNERFLLKLELKNYLGFEVVLKRLRLAADGDPVELERETVEQVKLEPNEAWLQMELAVVPRREATEFHITGLSFELEHGESSLNCLIPIELNERNYFSPETSCLGGRGKECRISAKVLSESYPHLRIDLPPTRHVNAFCGQIYCVDLNVCNDGSVAVQDMCLVTNRPSMVSLSEPRTLAEGEVITWMLSECSLSSADRNILVFRPKLGVFGVGEKRRLRLAFRAPLEESKDFPLSLMLYYCAENGVCRQERHLITITSQSLLYTSLSTISDAGDMCLLHARNLIPRRESLLAKVELFGVRSVSYVQKTSSKLSSERQAVFLKSVKNRVVHLECEQADNICLTIHRGVEAANGPVTWLNTPVQDFLEWPVLPVTLNLGSAVGSVPSGIVNKNCSQFGVLWKANIVNTDGTVANVFGENFVECFHPVERVPSLPDTLSSLSLFEKTVSVNKLDQTCSSSVDAMNDLQALTCSVTCRTATVAHDFSKERLCQFPVEVTVINNDRLQRGCDLTLRCIAPGDSSSFANSGGIKRSSETGPFSSVVSLTPSFASLQPFVPTTVQPLTMLSCARSRGFVASGSTHVFRVYLSVASASVYNITCFDLNAQFQGAQALRIALPFSFVTVVDKRMKGKR